MIREIRKIKSPFEVDLMRKAGDIANRVYQEGRNILREGMTEIEFGGLLVAAQKSSVTKDCFASGPSLMKRIHGTC